MVYLLGVVLVVLLLVISRATDGNWTDFVLVVVLYLAGLALCLALGPLVSMNGYRDYLVYADGLGLRDVPSYFPLWRWYLAGHPSFSAMFHLTAVLAAALLPITFLVSRTLGLERSASMAVCVVFACSSSFLVYGPGANSMMQLVVSGALAFLLSHLALQPVRRLRVQMVMAVAAGGLAMLAWFAKPEGVLVLLLIPAMMALDRRSSGKRRLFALAGFGLTVLGVQIVFYPAVIEILYPYVAHRVVSKGPSMLEEWFMILFFLAANGFVIGVGILVCSAVKFRELRAVKTTLILPVIGYSAMYALASDHMRHQLMLLPFFLPLCVLALGDIARHRRLLARTLGVVGAVWIVITGVVNLLTFRFDPKQEEFEQLRHELHRYPVVYYMPYSRDLSEPDAPLIALAGPGTRIEALRPPPGCPPNLFHALWAMHRTCTRDTTSRQQCQQAVQAAGPDWLAQAAALADWIGPGLEASMSREPPWPRDFNLPAQPPGRQAASILPQESAAHVLFVPVWTRSRKFKWYHAEPDLTTDKFSAWYLLVEIFLQVNNDTTAWRFPQFRWMDAAGLTLQTGADGVGTPPGPLVPVLPRDAADARAACLEIRQRPEGARLFARIEDSP